MTASEKLKIALDETRMPVLGAQVFLGLQLRGAFEDIFDDLSTSSKLLAAVALMLMTLVVTLLIAPAIHHRLVDEGNATARIFGAIRAFMMAALIPFALSLGINMFIVIERMANAVAAAMAALAVTAIALWFWFGVGMVALRSKGGKV